MDDFLSNPRYSQARAIKFTYGTPYDLDTSCYIALKKEGAKWVSEIVVWERYAPELVDYYNMESEAEHRLSKTSGAVREIFYNYPNLLKYLHVLYDQDIQVAKDWERRFFRNGKQMRMVEVDEKPVFIWDVFRPKPRPLSEELPEVPETPEPGLSVDLFSPDALARLRASAKKRVHASYGSPDGVIARFDVTMTPRGSEWDIATTTTSRGRAPGEDQPSRVSPDETMFEYNHTMSPKMLDLLFSNLVEHESLKPVSLKIGNMAEHPMHTCIIDGLDLPTRCRIELPESAHPHTRQCFDVSRVPRMEFVQKS